MVSSSVRMTRTLVGLASVEISGSPAAFRPSSRAIPRNSSPSQARRRTSGEFSPMPPEKTSESSPPRAAARAPIPVFTR